MSWFRFLFVAWLPLVAHAGSDLAPFNGQGGIQINNGKTDQIFYPLEPGSHLDYALSGPGRVWIYVRSGARPTGAWTYPINMELPVEVFATKIDGVPLAPALDNFGSLVDQTSTYPWLSKGILVDIPEASNTVRLAARLDGPPLLIRVMVPSPGKKAPLAETPTPTPEESTPSVADTQATEEESVEPDLLDDAFYEGGKDDTDAQSDATESGTSSEDTELGTNDEAPPDEAVSADIRDDEAVAEIIDVSKETPIGDESFGGRYEIFDEEAETLGENPESLDEAVDLSADDTPEAVTPKGFSDRLLHSAKAIQVGIATGIGVPLQGDRMMATAIAQGRMEVFPVLWDGWEPGWGRLDLSLSAAWYPIVVNSSIQVPDAIAGNSQIDVAYTTHVIPVSFGLHYDIPLRMGPILPFVGAGGGFAIATRSSAEKAGLQIAGSYYGELGVQYTTGRFTVTPTLNYNGVRADFGRIDTLGNPVSENLSSLRLIVAAQTHF